jgi:hypothetical protein
MERTTTVAVDRPGVARSAVAAAALVAVASIAGAMTAAPTLCPVALLTGTPCPGCGMTRAVVALARGDLRASWAAHPLAALVVVEGAVVAASGALQRLGRIVRPPARHVTWAAGLTAGALVVVWLVRYALGTLPVV